MPCYHPIVGYRSKAGRSRSTGLWPVVFDIRDGYIDKEVIIPCGKCIGCKLERSRQWAIRCVNEASMYSENSFVTLTYADANLPIGGSLVHRDFQLFMKRLRKKRNNKLKYFMSGEYGTDYLRPHYHACIFNCDFPDKVLWSNSCSRKANVKLYRSKELEGLWEFGFSTIGEVTFESAAYLARYCIKGSKENKAVIFGLQMEPEYSTMSRRPGIGSSWFKKFKSDVLSIDNVIIRNDLRCRMPRYYNDVVHKENPRLLERMKRLRQRKVIASENTWERLAIKEELKLSRVKLLERSYEYA